MAEFYSLGHIAGRPEDSGISLQTVQELGPILPIFGVCMGHQCIGQVFGGKIVRAPSGVMHGKSSPVYHRNLGTLKVVRFLLDTGLQLPLRPNLLPDVIGVFWLLLWSSDVPPIDIHLLSVSASYRDGGLDIIPMQ